MGTLNEDLSAIKEVEDKIIANKVARFAYTDEAYTTNDANGVAEIFSRLTFPLSSRTSVSSEEM